MQKVSIYNLPAAGSANPTTVRCTMVTRKMAVTEDGSANAGVFQGVMYRLPLPNSLAFGDTQWGPWATVPPNELLEPIIFEGAPNDHDPNAPPIGNGGSSPYPVAPGGPVTLGTVIFQATSMTANPTTVNVTEWN